MRRLKLGVTELRSDVTEIRSEVARFRSTVDNRFDRFERAVDARFEQVHATMASNLAVVLEALKARWPSVLPDGRALA